MSATHAPIRAKSKPGRSASPSGGSSAAPAHADASGGLGVLHGAGPAFGLGGVQRQIAIGKAGDSFEKEADQAAEKIAAGKSIEPNDISKVDPGSLAQTQANEERKPVQKAETAKMPEKKPDAVQKAEAKPPEQKVDDKKPVQKAEAPKMPEKKPDAMQKAEAGKPEDKKPVQKAETAKMPEKKPDAVQKAEAKPPEQKVDDKQPVQKAEAAKMPEKKPDAVQKAEAAKPEDKKPVQKAETAKTPEKEPDAVQKAEAKPPEQKVDDKQPVQKDGPAGSGAGGGGMAAAASQAIASKGAGQALNPSTRGQLESGLGVDLGHVRVHDDARARQAADDLNARAFTHGSDIWLGEGASQQDTHLMAHEATHVVQQAGGVRRMVQKAGKGSGGGAPAAAAGTASPDTLKSPAGTIDVKNKKMLLPELKIPAFKYEYLPSAGFVTIQKGGTDRPEGSESQRAIWRDKLGPAVENASKQRLQGLKGIRRNPSDKKNTDIAEDATDSPNKMIFLPLKGGQVTRRGEQINQKDSYLIGTPDQLKSELIIPRWDSKGQPRPMDVDHKVELQLGGKNIPENLHLLDASSNRSSGSKINFSILDSIANAVKPHVGKEPFKTAPSRTEQSALKAQYEITYETIKPDAGMDPPGKDARWHPDEVQQVEKPLAAVTPPLSAAEVRTKKLLGEPTRLVLYPLDSGGAPKDIAWDDEKRAPKATPDWQKLGFKGLGDPAITYDEDTKKGEVTGMWPIPKKGKKAQVEPKKISLPLSGVGDFPFTCRLEKGGLLQSMRYAELYAFSKVEFQRIDMDESRGISARGKLAPSQPFFQKLDIDIVVDGDGVSLEKTFTKNDFSFPGPIQVSEASLTVSLGQGGLEVGGEIILDIPRLGTGRISGRVGKGGELELEGSIDFDSDLFKPANVTVTYAGGKFSGSGQLGIQPGKVKGVKSANIAATFSGDEIKATGSVVPDIPAVEQGNMSLEYKKETGLTIGGTLTLKKDLPGIEGGSVSAQVTKKPGEERYIVKASGTATPKIPGISSHLTVSYDDGLFDASVTAGYEKGRLKGSLTAGATNRPVDDKGQPAGGAAGEKADKIVFYGGGSLSLKLAPWLQATAGVMFKPNGEIQISGEIGLPEALNIFPEKKLDKNIFKVGVDIPIVGVSVAGQRIGIFANITGGLDLGAGIGPGQLQALKLKVDYNPAHEDQTHVQGDAKLHVPAHAGLRMFVRGGLGVGIPIVSAQAGIEMGGQLGLEGALDTGVHVDWSPAKGLVLDANAEVYVEPKLKFDITGFVLVEADLLLTTIELYNKRWQLAGFEYGSGLRFGVSFPVHYEEGKELNLSLDNVKFQVPDIRPKDVLSDLIKKI